MIDKVSSWCVSNGRGEHAEVRIVSDDKITFFQVIHGHMPVTLMTVSNAGRKPLKVRLAHVDLISYDASTGRLRISTRSADLVAFYRKLIGMRWERFMGRSPKPTDLPFPSGKPHLTHGQFRNTNLALKQFHRHCELLDIRSRRIHDSRRSFISLARDDGASATSSRA